MRTSEEIRDFVDSAIGAILERPKMFASTPESLEEILSQLDIVREFMASTGDSNVSRYARHLRDNRYEAMSFTGAARPSRALTQEDLDLFAKTSQFFRQYLEAKNGE